MRGTLIHDLSSLADICRFGDFGSAKRNCKRLAATFSKGGVLMHDQIRPYRPPALRNHRAVGGYWSVGTLAPTRHPLPRATAQGRNRMCGASQN
jgi:hypothetical protein